MNKRLSLFAYVIHVSPNHLVSMRETFIESDVEVVKLTNWLVVGLVTYPCVEI